MKCRYTFTSGEFIGEKCDEDTFSGFNFCKVHSYLECYKRCTFRDDENIFKKCINSKVVGSEFCEMHLTHALNIEEEKNFEKLIFSHREFTPEETILFQLASCDFSKKYDATTPQYESISWEEKNRDECFFRQFPSALMTKAIPVNYYQCGNVIYYRSECGKRVYLLENTYSETIETKLFIYDFETYQNSIFNYTHKIKLKYPFLLWDYDMFVCTKISKDVISLAFYRNYEPISWQRVNIGSLSDETGKIEKKCARLGTKYYCREKKTFSFFLRKGKIHQVLGKTSIVIRSFSLARKNPITKFEISKSVNDDLYIVIKEYNIIEKIPPFSPGKKEYTAFEKIVLSNNKERKYLSFIIDIISVERTSK